MRSLRGYGENVGTCTLGFVDDVACGRNDSNPVKSDIGRQYPQYQTAIDLMGQDLNLR